MQKKTLVAGGVGGAAAIGTIIFFAAKAAMGPDVDPQFRDIVFRDEEFTERFGKLNSAELAHLAPSFNALANALPTDSTAPSGVESADSWAGWLKLDRPSSAEEIDEIIAIVRAPAQLPGGRVIPQRFNDSDTMRTKIAAVGCGTGGLTIYYHPYAIAALNPSAVTFLKYHELGHVAKGHYTCPDSGKSYKEKDADCWAVDQLRGSPTGVLAIGAAAEFFFSRNDPAHDGYESSQARSRYLRIGCGTPFG